MASSNRSSRTRERTPRGRRATEFQIVIKPFNVKRFLLKVKAHDTLAQVKWKIHWFYALHRPATGSDLSPQMQRLSFGGRELLNNQCALADYFISDRCQVKLAMTSREAIAFGDPD